MTTEYVHVDEKAIESVAIPHYSEEEHGTWKLLLEKQLSLMEGRACHEFIEGVRAVDFPAEHIPALRDISARIERATGWQLIRVDGLVHPKDFLALLARRLFPSTDFIRKRAELDYTPEPDMFHDLFGHVPLLTNPDFTEFFQAFGEIGVNAYNKYPAPHPIHDQVARIYWFTVEFGLIRAPEGVRAYGSGSVSSPQELSFCVSSQCQHLPFDVATIAAKTYDIWHVQEEVFVIESFPQLGQEFRRWARAQGIL
jgi:phenylalanine-4-hydroxylase